MEKQKYEIDMCNGSLFGKILRFSLPLMASSILQLLFNAADVIVVGRFAGSEALAAVGSNTALINLLTNLFVGLSIGANVLVARYIGAKKKEETEQTVHTAVMLGLIGGIILALIGFFFSGGILELMGTPLEVLPLAKIYLQIYFLGMPATMLYNFGAALLRAVGDTKRPLYYLIIAGILNVVLNLLFVLSFHMSVAGVALATVISQIVSTVLVCRCLMSGNGEIHLQIRKLHIHKAKFIEILRIGLPAGLQGVIFAVSNVLIQSSVNSFGAVAMAGNTAAANIEGFVYMAMNAFYQANVSFTSQNYGAHKMDRIKKSLLICELCGIAIGITLGWTVMKCGPFLLRFYCTEDNVIAYGMLRLKLICGTYFLCAVMDVIVGTLRGLGYGMLPMIVSLMGACAFRIVWIFTVFSFNRKLEVLYISYPISWILTAIAQAVCLFVIWRKLTKKMYRVEAS